MSFRKAYYYFFYKIYKTIQYTSESLGEFWIDAKTALVIGVLEVWLLLSINNYFSLLIKKTTEISIKNPVVLILLFFVIGVNYISFIQTNVWKDYNKKFDELPKNINRKGSWIVFGIVLFIIVNFMFSLYLLYQMKRE